MTTEARRRVRLRFGVYEIDARTGEVWREGAPVHLPPQPFKVLWLLASRAGDVVTREEIRQELWGTDTFVDFDGSLNFCINQIRKVLRDSAESPRFIHTLPRRGYRFIASVETIAATPVIAEEGGAGPAGAEAVGAAAGGDPDAEDDGGSPRARASHLYEVVRETGVDARRWRSGSGLARLSASPVALADEPAEERPQELPARAVDPARAEPEKPAMPLETPAQVRGPGRPGAPGPAIAAPPFDPAPPARPGRTGRGALLAAGLAALVVLAMGTILLTRTQRPQPVYERLTFRRGTVASARFGPSGDVAYTAAWDGGTSHVYDVRPGETGLRPLDLPPHAYLQAVLASGDDAVVIENGGEMVLALAPPFGGKPREVAAGVAGADVSRDGATIVITRTGPEDHIELPAGHEVYHVPAKISGLRLSPSGDRVAFFEHPIPLDDRGEVVTVDRAGRRTVISRDWASLEGLAWGPDGREVWFTGAKVGADSTLNAVSASGGTERVVVRGPGRLVLHDIRPDGAVLLERNTRRMELREHVGDGGDERDLSWLDLTYVTDVSADASKVVFSESGEGGGAAYGVFLRASDGSPPVRLGEGRAMTLSPDGRWVLTVPLFGPPRILALPTGAGEPKTLAVGLTRQVWARWFPDSRHVLFAAAEPGQPLRPFVQDLDGGKAEPIAPEASLAPGLVAPDGRHALLRTVGVTGHWQLLAIPDPSTGPPVTAAATPVALDGRDRPLSFTPDGKDVFVLPAWKEGPVVVEKVDLSSGTRSRWREIKAQDGSGVAHISPVVITPDGQSYAYSIHRDLSELYLVNGLR